MGWYLIVATIPIGLLGFAFQDQIETGARNLWLIGTTLIVFALVMLYADQRGRHERTRPSLRVRDGIGIGLRSRSRSFRACRAPARRSAPGLLLGLQRPAAARFAFLLADPGRVASGLFELYGILTGRRARASRCAICSSLRCRLRSRLRRDRLAAAPTSHPHGDHLRGLPHRAGHTRARPAGPGAIS